MGKPAGTRARVARISGAFAALALSLTPKCPLCLLPLAAAAGVTLPSKPLLDLGVGLAAFAWAALVLASQRPAAVKGIATAAALLLVAGRAAGLDGAVWAGAAGMLASALVPFRDAEGLSRPSLRSPGLSRARPGGPCGSAGHP
jgi:hypothetical protein